MGQEIKYNNEYLIVLCNYLHTQDHFSKEAEELIYPFHKIIKKRAYEKLK